MMSTYSHANIDETKSLMLFNFGKETNEKPWRTITDTVMGGRSGSQFSINKFGRAIFEGNVSLENNGGFASVRSYPDDHDLSLFTGLAMRVKGDGKQYKFNLRTDHNFDGIQYQVSFETQKDEWILVLMPFEDFVPTYHGRQLTSVSAFDPSKVKTFGVLISDKQEGQFRLEIDWIKAVDVAENRQ